jgi:hypothetical protein
MVRHAPIVFVALLAAGHGIAAPPPVTVTAEMMTIVASNDGSGIDPRLGKRPELSRPPFSAYDSYKLLGSSPIQLTKGRTSTTTLPNANMVSLTLKKVVRKKGDPTRYLIAASIQSPGGSTVLPAQEVPARAGEPFFVAGQQYRGGILVVGVKVIP